MIIVMHYPDSIGHLSLALTGLGKEKNIYISFFPPNFSSHAGFRLHSLEHDEAHSVAQMVTLPSEESCGFGLSEQAIYDWWQNRFVKENGGFGWFTNNCSSVVYKALHEGQIHSSSIQQSSIKKKGFCTPGTVLNYARDLTTSLLGKYEKKDNMHLLFAELQQYCELGKLNNPIQQTLAIYSRINQFNSSKQSLILSAPFCHGIKNVLTAFQSYIRINENRLTSQQFQSLLSLSETSDIQEVDIHAHTEKLHTLIKYIFTSMACKKLNHTFINKLETLVKRDLLAALSEQIGHFESPELKTSKSIKPALLKIKEKIQDGKNPHKHHFHKGDDMPRDYGFRR